MPAGRPTLYLPTYCDEAISFMGQGYSLTAFAGEIGVSRETVYEWERTVPEFSDAIKKARAKRVLALERKLFSSGTSAEVTTAIFSLKNACPAEWRDKIEIAQNSTVTIRDERSKIEAEIDALLGHKPSKLNGNGAVH